MFNPSGAFCQWPLSKHLVFCNNGLLNCGKMRANKTDCTYSFNRNRLLFMSTLFVGWFQSSGNECLQTIQGTAPFTRSQPSSSFECPGIAVVLGTEPTSCKATHEPCQNPKTSFIDRTEIKFRSTSESVWNLGPIISPLWTFFFLIWKVGTILSTFIMVKRIVFFLSTRIHLRR